MPLKKPAATANTVIAEKAGVEALGAASAELRWAAARGLAGDTAAVAALDKACATETDSRVREAILSSLAGINNQESFTAVARYVRAEDAQRRSEALETLKLMPDLLLQNLDALLHDADVDTRILICDLTRFLTGPRPPILLAELLLHDTEVNVCAAVIDVLAETGGPSQIASLDACAARFPGEPFLAFAVKTAVLRIRARYGA